MVQVLKKISGQAFVISWKYGIPAVVDIENAARTLKMPSMSVLTVLRVLYRFSVENIDQRTLIEY
jgi:hypothetical protein